MRKLDIVNQIHSKTNINRQDIKKVVESFMKEIKQSLNNGQNIYLRGF